MGGCPRSVVTFKAAAYGRKELCDYFLKVSGRKVPKKMLFRDYFFLAASEKGKQLEESMAGEDGFWLQKAPDLLVSLARCVDMTKSGE